VLDFLLNGADSIERVYAAQHLKTAYFQRNEHREIFKTVLYFVLNNRSVSRQMWKTI
jgi:hypothetical protein